MKQEDTRNAVGAQKSVDMTETEEKTHRAIISSFGHKFGTPGADHVLNARKAKNPGQWARGSTGLNKKVRQAVFQDDKAHRLVEQGVQLVEAQLLERSPTEPPVHCAVGCDRGQHRSVAIAIEIAAELKKRGIDVLVEHRDIK